MNGQHAKLLISAASVNQFPDSPQFECVMVGKSNVGKSTLINGLMNRKNLAYVGSRPGKTRLVNFYEINDQLMLVDVPGYGFAKRSAKEQEQYATLMEHYFLHRKQCGAMFVVMDVRRDFSDDDEMMLTIARDKKMPCAIVLSKSDKVSFSQLKQKTNQIRQKTGYPVYAFGLKTPEAFEQIRQQLQVWLSQLSNK